MSETNIREDLMLAWETLRRAIQEFDEREELLAKEKRAQASDQETRIKRTTMTVKEASVQLGISIPKVIDLTHRQDFPAIRLGRRIVIPIDKFDEWLDAQAGVPQ
jgi:excisionase family DNA binding protein